MCSKKKFFFLISCWFSDMEYLHIAENCFHKRDVYHNISACCYRSLINYKQQVMITSSTGFSSFCPISAWETGSSQAPWLVQSHKSVGRRELSAITSFPWGLELPSPLQPHMPERRLSPFLPLERDRKNFPKTLECEPKVTLGYSQYKIPHQSVSVTKFIGAYEGYRL